MKLIADLVAAFAAACGASCGRPIIAQWFHNDWYPLVLRVIGVLLLYAAFEKVHHDMEEMEEGVMRRFAAFFLSAGAIGAGAATARAIVRER